MNYLILYFSDESGFQARYEPISVIDYQGRLAATGQSQGHYTCDVKDVKTNKWYRTNDNSIPVQIEKNNVSNHAYVVLYKHKVH